MSIFSVAALVIYKHYTLSKCSSRKYNYYQSVSYLISFFQIKHNICVELLPCASLYYYLILQKNIFPKIFVILSLI